MAAHNKDDERRQNQTLRELLDDMVDHVRELARNARTASPDELDYAQQRLEWLADEIWRAATRDDPLE